MEENYINIAAILKDKPRGTKLWSDTFGYVHLLDWHSDFFDVKDTIHNLSWRFSSDGSLKDYKGSLSIYPAQYMRDWSKFTWKKGDVLDSNDGLKSCIFVKWTDDTYTQFFCKYHYCDCPANEEAWQFQIKCNTEDFYKSNAPESFIELLENHADGKLNLETLSIERDMTKDIVGELCYFEGKGGCFVSMLEKINEDTFEFGDIVCWKDGTPDKKEYSIKTLEPVRKEDLTVLRHATKQEIHEYMITKGRHTLKTFDKVLVRGDDEGKDDAWIPAFFIMMDGNDESSPYYCKSLEAETAELYKHCIPYKGNEHLAFTTDQF